MLHYTYLLSAIILLFSQTAKAKVVPAEDKTLNYRIVGFSAPPNLTASGYTLQIAKGRFHSADSFKKNIIVTKQSKSEKIIAEVPAFGTQYTWRVVYNFRSNAHAAGQLYHFSTGSDTNTTRFRVTQKAKGFKGTYVFLDRNKTLYDMNGRAVWYLPEIEGKQQPPSDLKITQDGTITFISDNAYEINYDGEVLWKLPLPNGNDAAVERAHHEFTKFANGHYMALSGEWTTIPADTSESPDINEIQRQDRTIRFGSIVEYDANGKVVWSWNSAKYFIEKGIINHPSFINRIEPHENAFYFDRDQQAIYLSCKEFNTILKIKYPEGDVIGSYGEATADGLSRPGNRLFCGQHAVRRNKEGCIFLYNNNDCGQGAPKVKIMKEPQSPGDDLKIIWEYECCKDKAIKADFTAGGNVTELTGGAYLVCMGGTYSKIFIVNSRKETLWSGLPEMMTDKGWSNNYVYRASIIENREKLVDLIWHGTNSPTNNTAINTARITP